MTLTTKVDDMTEPTNLWEALRAVPDNAKKPIRGGRLNGMTDINPMWRWSKLTEVFGPCGVGWRFEVVRLWLEPGANGEVAAFAQVNLSVRNVDGIGGWNDPVPGIGGSMFVASQKGSLHVSDEAYKMAVTDALGTAAKMLGLGADVYWQGGMERTKYDARTQGVVDPDDIRLGDEPPPPPKTKPMPDAVRDIVEYFKGQHLSNRREEDKPKIAAMLAACFGGVTEWADVLALPTNTLELGAKALTKLDPNDF